MATGGADKVVKVWCWREGQGISFFLACNSWKLLCVEKLEPKCSLTGSGASVMSVQFDHQVTLAPLTPCS